MPFNDCNGLFLTRTASHFSINLSEGAPRDFPSFSPALQQQTSGEIWFSSTLIISSTHEVYTVTLWYGPPYVLAVTSRALYAVACLPVSANVYHTVYCSVAGTGGVFNGFVVLVFHSFHQLVC